MEGLSQNIVDGVRIAICDKPAFVAVCESVEKGESATALTPPLKSVEDCEKFKKEFEKQHPLDAVMVTCICRLEVVKSYL